MSYGQEGPCTLAEAQEDDEDRVTIRLTMTAQPMIDALAKITAQARVTGLPSRSQSSAVRMDVPAAARAGEALCGFTVERDGEEGPCERPAAGHRWYQGHGHEDTLDVACEWHRNPGGDLIASLRAKVARVEALPDEWAYDFRDAPRVDRALQKITADLATALADPAPVEQQDDEVGR